MGINEIHPRALRELVDVVTKPHLAMSEKSWWSGDDPGD